MCRSEAEQRSLADAAVRDAGAGAQSVRRAAAMEEEMHAMQIKEAQLQQRLVHQLNEYKNMEDRCLKVRLRRRIRRIRAAYLKSIRPATGASILVGTNANIG